MKTRIETFIRILIVVAYFISPDSKIFCQDTKKAELSLGIGFPEALNIGFKYQIKQSQVGVSFGYWPGDPDSFLFDFNYAVSLCGDYYYHFGNKPKYPDLNPWYARVGLNCWLLDWGSDIEPYLNIPLRIGRNFNFSPKSGFSLDGGVLFVV